MNQKRFQQVSLIVYWVVIGLMAALILGALVFDHYRHETISASATKPKVVMVTNSPLPAPRPDGSVLVENDKGVVRLNIQPTFSVK